MLYSVGKENDDFHNIMEALLRSHLYQISYIHAFQKSQVTMIRFLSFINEQYLEIIEF